MHTAEQFWDSVADKYAKSPIKDMTAYEKTIERTRAHLSKDDMVLELGCGTGSTALLLAPSVRHITATDISSRMVQIAEEKVEDQGIENVEFLQSTHTGDALTEPFDAVLAYNYLHLLENPAEEIARVQALLKPGGVFISKTVCLIGRYRLVRLILPLMRLFRMAPANVSFLKPEAVDAMMKDAGFQIVETGNYPTAPVAHFVVARKPL